MKAGDLRAVVTHEGCAPLFVKGRSLPADRDTEETFRFVSGGRVRGAVKGKVPLRDARESYVLLRRAGHPHRTFQPGQAEDYPELQWAEVHDEGSFEIAHVAPGTYQVELCAVGGGRLYLRTDEEIVVAEGKHVEIEITFPEKVASMEAFKLQLTVKR